VLAEEAQHTTNQIEAIRLELSMSLGDDLDPVTRWRWPAADAREAAHQSTDPENQVNHNGHRASIRAPRSARQRAQSKKDPDNNK
jgi:hypothetical protein